VRAVWTLCGRWARCRQSGCRRRSGDGWSGSWGADHGRTAGTAVGAGPWSGSRRCSANVPHWLPRAGGGEAAAPARLVRAGARPPGDRTGRRGDRGGEDRGVAGDNRTAADLGAYLCFEDEAGQGLRPPTGRTWGRRGPTPVMRVRGGGRGWISVAGVLGVKPGARAHLFSRLRRWRGRTGERRGFTWTDHRDLIVAAHHQLDAPLVWVWDNLTVHRTGELTELHRAERAVAAGVPAALLRPGPQPVEGVWSLVKGHWPTSPQPTSTTWSA
jgi:transposase